MYIKLTNGTPTIYTIGQLRRDNPQTSFPKKVSDEILAEYNVYRCVTQDVADFNRETHQSVNGNIEQVDGVWTQLRTVEQRPSDEVAKRMRQKRDAKLADTDWWAVSDRTMTAEQTTYRQALRDITDHENFPYLTESDWPVKPE